jgi:hypothetical protein
MSEPAGPVSAPRVSRMEAAGVEPHWVRFSNPLMANDFWPQGFDRSLLTLRSLVPGSPQQSSRINHRHGDMLETGRDDYALATFARRKKSAGIGRCNFHTNEIGRSPLCDT